MTCCLPVFAYLIKSDLMNPLLILKFQPNIKKLAVTFRFLHDEKAQERKKGIISGQCGILMSKILGYVGISCDISITVSFGDTVKVIQCT